MIYCRYQKKVGRRKGEIMSEQTENLLTGMADAGCTKEEIKRVGCFLKAGSFNELTKFLKQCRCALMEQMHESQKRVDRMDYLIRQSEKFSVK